MSSAKELLLQLFTVAVETAQPKHSVPKNLPPRPSGHTVVVGAGKAAAAMAEAVEAHWQGALSGLVIAPYGGGGACKHIEIVQARHPIPDDAGYRATERILGLVQGLSADDLVLCLISGGGSALLAGPAKGISLTDKQALTKALLKSGAPISEFNCVRKHLSGVKGGRLALAAYPAKVVSLIISDVPGDDPAVIASGPTVADPTTSRDALAILKKYHIEPPEPVLRWLNDPASETPKPGEPKLARVENRVIGSGQVSLDAAARTAKAAGYTPINLGDAIEGEARDVARRHAELARVYARKGQRCALISGGETTVTVTGNGRGGRNTEYLLALALALDGAPGIHAIACGTDGIDGTEDNAGAVITPDTLTRAKAKGIDLQAMLANNDAYSAFHALGDLVVTGPTRTNVNDFRAILIRAA